MPDIEPIPLPQETVGLKLGDENKINTLLLGIRRKYKECLGSVLVERERIDPRILKYEKQLHEVNGKRARSYGREYNPPEIFYVDRSRAAQKAAEINHALNQDEDLIQDGLFDENIPAAYLPFTHSVIIFVNNFDDRDVDSWDACRKLGHELRHAGSVRKHRIRPARDTRVISRYRVGAQLFSRRREGVLGRVIDEGFHAIEDGFFEDQNQELLAQDEFLRTLPSGEQLFPGARKKYEQLRRFARFMTGGQIGLDQMLVSYRKNKEDPSTNDIIKSDSYEDYSDLLKSMYARNPQLLNLTGGFIYGDNMIVFGREVDRSFGKGFFKRLMSVEDRFAAKKLMHEIGVRP